ncbi:hypothetical protein PFLUV_G00138470 [Perca fluviatilis]|uniref:Secreted protein n=1 Tax=Perca fluviatilis TaxID=8168 RepID=A0A6A5E5Q0_PERFL|nr:hypothetical protein PFLUV_G00138470 [Perca fluviatilis]
MVRSHFSICSISFMLISASRPLLWPCYPDATAAHQRRDRTEDLTGDQRQQNPTPEAEYNGDTPELLCPPEDSVRQADLCA